MSTKPRTLADDISVLLSIGISGFMLGAVVMTTAFLALDLPASRRPVVYKIIQPKEACK